MENKRIYISDLHMNDARSLAYPDARHHYGWLDKSKAGAVAAFLSYVADCTDVSEVILLGDVVDTWVCPVNLVPQTLDEIFTAPQNQGIITQLNRIISKNIHLTYVVGNHDMDITDAVLQKYIPGIRLICDPTYHGYYSTGMMRGEHGNAYAMFNAPDAQNGMFRSIPLGYFISRIAASKVIDARENVHDFMETMDALVSVGQGETLPERVVDAVLLYSSLSEDTPIMLPDHTSVTAKQVKEKYAGLYRQWVAMYGADKALKATLAELGHLGYAADELCTQLGVNVVLFGHTHIEKIDKDTLMVNDHIYVNTGTWCESPKRPCTFVETQRDPARNRQYVRLMHWEKGKPKLHKEEWLKG